MGQAILNNLQATFILLGALLSIGYTKAYARWNVDIGTGAVFSGYNDVRIPNDSGTDISLSNELETDPDYFVRVTLTRSMRNRHNIEVFAAPLRLEANGTVRKSVRFGKEEFSANIPLRAVYRSDSYRLTYRYDLFRGRRFQAGLGFTAKIRDASISLDGGGKESEEKNAGFVPLINFRVQWTFAKKLSLLLTGDVFNTTQERAEDVLLAIQYELSKNLSLKLGYRILESGTDLEEIYNFTLLNYILVGPTLTF